jgi:membrane protein YqaA with SNARE-associated domain
MEETASRLNKLAKSGHARMWLVLLSFSESSFFIIPPDVLLLAMLSFGEKKWKHLVFLTSAASVAGAVFGYLVGAFLFEPLAQPIISFYGLTDKFNYVGDLYTSGVFLAVFTAAFTPIPFKVFVLSAGFFNVPFIPFLFAGALGRTLRFSLVAWLSKEYGPLFAKKFLENFKKITYLFLLFLFVVLVVFYFIYM